MTTDSAGKRSRSAAESNPYRVNAAGRYPDITTSASASSASIRSRCAASAKSEIALRLPKPVSRYWSTSSGFEGGSTRNTSAPRSARNRVATGPAITRVRSKTLTPESLRPGTSGAPRVSPSSNRIHG
ncbi:Uncharacterised protein [Mycobacteroides abscessus]|nr:Uncharacterised protein [Mycobacteroides abscessus]